jgi:hypothetical protein
MAARRGSREAGSRAAPVGVVPSAGVFVEAGVDRVDADGGMRQRKERNPTGKDTQAASMPGHAIPRRFVPSRSAILPFP